MLQPAEVEDDGDGAERIGMSDGRRREETGEEGRRQDVRAGTGEAIAADDEKPMMKYKLGRSRRVNCGVTFSLRRLYGVVCPEDVMETNMKPLALVPLFS